MGPTQKQRVRPLNGKIYMALTNEKVFNIGIVEGVRHLSQPLFFLYIGRALNGREPICQNFSC